LIYINELRLLTCHPHFRSCLPISDRDAPPKEGGAFFGEAGAGSSGASPKKRHGGDAMNDMTPASERSGKGYSSPSNPLAKHIAVIGAGAAGICAAKYLSQAGFEVTIFEIGSHIGGLWVYDNDSGMSAAYRTLHINTAKNLTQFSDFPFDDTVQRYPDHRDMTAYFNKYADHFDLRRRILFNTEVTDVRPAFTPGSEAPKWEIESKDGRVRTFDSVMVCTGHLWKPMHVPDFEKFTGTYLHGHNYREPNEYVGKRICVVGTGNSAVDIASDVCVNADRCVMVARTGVVIAPKLMFGIAFTDITEKLYKTWIPDRFRRWFVKTMAWVAHGNMERYGFPPITKRVHPTTSATVINDIAYNRIVIRQGIEKIDGRKITFTDGSAEEFDVLIAATGYLIDLPFIKPEIVEVKDNRIDLFRRVVAPEWPGLYFIGMINSTTALNRNYENQMRWVTKLETGECLLPSRNEMHAQIRSKNEFVAQNYKDTPRHTIEEEHIIYFPELKREIADGRRRARQAGIRPGVTQRVGSAAMAR
jgi:dimethylaniline monooxygenase (N-oxide forming)